MKVYFLAGIAADSRIFKNIHLPVGFEAILNWTNQKTPENLYHIHGTRDEVFPFALTSPTHIIKKGGHVLVMSHAEEINKIISEILNNNKEINAIEMQSIIKQ